MVHKDGARADREAFDPIQQSLLIGVATGAVEGANLGVDGDGLPEELQFLGPMQERMSGRAHGLIPHEEDRVLWIPQIVFQMVPDAASVAHTAG